MRRWMQVSIAVGVAAVAGYAELVLDMRAPSSELRATRALGASASLSMAEYNQAIRKYGNAAQVSLQTSSGRIRIEIGGRIVEELQVQRQFGGMYGMFIIAAGDDNNAIFPLAVEPGELPDTHEPNIQRLKSHFETTLVSNFLAFTDKDWTRDSCTLSQPPNIGVGHFASWLRLRASTSCLIHWKRGDGPMMLVTVALADGDPWMRPFSRRLCRAISETALTEIVGSGGVRPQYAACILVDRPDQTGPTGAQTAFTSEIYEVRRDGLARLTDVRTVQFGQASLSDRHQR